MHQYAQSICTVKDCWLCASAFFKIQTLSWRFCFLSQTWIKVSRPRVATQLSTLSCDSLHTSLLRNWKKDSQLRPHCVHSYTANLLLSSLSTRSWLNPRFPHGPIGPWSRPFEEPIKRKQKLLLGNLTCQSPSSWELITQWNSTQLDADACVVCYTGRTQSPVQRIASNMPLYWRRA